MAGNTGKMTNEAIAARGPRMVLAYLVNAEDSFFIFREDKPPMRMWNCGKALCEIRILCRSYTKSYLMGVARAYQAMA